MNPLKVAQLNRNRQLMVEFCIYLVALIGLGIGFTFLWNHLSPHITKFFSSSFVTGSVTDKIRQEIQKESSEIRLLHPPSAPEKKKDDYKFEFPIEFPAITATTEIIGPDGLESRIYIHVVSGNYHWRKNEIVVESGKKILSEDVMIDKLSKLYKDKQSEKMDAIVCVGTASYDVEDNQGSEEDRAFMRSLQLLIWTRKAMNQFFFSPKLYALSLGHYTNGEDKKEQRLIIILGIEKLNEKANIEALLSSENEKEVRKTIQEKLEKDDFPFNFIKYSEFTFLKRR
jgi:hypothetical protein